MVLVENQAPVREEHELGLVCGMEGKNESLADRSRVVALPMTEETKLEKKGTFILSTKMGLDLEVVDRNGRRETHPPLPRMCDITEFHVLKLQKRW